MKQAGDKLIQVISACFFAILALLPFHAFLTTWGGTKIGPLLLWKSWKEILLLLLLPLVIWFLWRRQDLLRAIWSRTVNKLIFAYIALHLLWALLFTQEPQAELGGLMFNLRFLAVFLLAQFIVLARPTLLKKIEPWLTPALLAVTVLIALLAVVQVTVLPANFLENFGYNRQDSIAPFILLDDNQDALRAFATLRGPNAFGAYLLLPIGLAALLLVKGRRNFLTIVALGLGLIALILSGSRSTWLGAVAMAVMLAFMLIPKKNLITVAKITLPIVVILTALVIWLAALVPSLRLVIFHSSPGDPSLIEGSSEAHLQATAAGIEQVVANPLGSGVGSAGPASFYNTAPNLAENYFVQIAQEVGLFGLAIFVAINVLILKHLWRARDQVWPSVLLASFAGLTVVNLFLHGWADDPTSMTWWALAGLFAFSTYKSRVKA